MTDTNSCEISINNVRVNFLNIFEKGKAFEGQDPKYSAEIYIEKKEQKEMIDRVIAGAKAAKVKKWGDQPPGELRKLIKNGDKEEDLPKDKEGKLKVKLGDEPYSKHIFFKVSTKNRPEIVDEYVEPIEDKNKIRNGDYCNLILQAYAYSKAGNSGVGLDLQCVQFVKTGESLSGRPRAINRFKKLEQEQELNDNIEDLPF